jgi:hypothetical protein
MPFPTNEKQRRIENEQMQRKLKTDDELNDWPCHWLCAGTGSDLHSPTEQIVKGVAALFLARDNTIHWRRGMCNVKRE